MTPFVAKTVLTADALNNAFNSIGYQGALTVSPKINGSTAGITGTFAGKFVQILNVVCLVQIQLSFSAIGSGVGDLTIDIDGGTNLYNASSLTTQNVGVVNVARMSGSTKTPINTTLFGIVQSKTMRIISSQYNGNATRVLNNTDLTATSYFELAGTYITGN